MLTMINIAAIASLRGLPISASYGFSIIFIYALAALFFLIPSALASAELATAFPESEGIFTWIKEAFGPRWGFLAVWMQFIANVTFYPLALSFAATSVAYFLNPSLAENKIYIYLLTLVCFWMATAINLKGIKVSGRVSSAGTMIGTLLPGIFIIASGVAWWLLGKPLAIEIGRKTLLPHPDIKNLVFISGVIFTFAGIEMSAIHAKDVMHPNRSYPKAIFIASTALVALLTLGSLAVAFVIPREELSFTGGVIAALSVFFRVFGMPFLTPLFALLIAVGTMSQISTWLIGSIRGISAIAEQGFLPPVLHRKNRHDMPVALMIAQALLVSVLSLVFLIMPNTNTAFWILGALTTQLYLIMYMLLFVAVIYLRYKQPLLERPFRIFGGKKGLFLIGGTGFFTSLAVFLINFVPPDLIAPGNLLFYEGILIIGNLLFCAVPFISKKTKLLPEPT